ncbi:MULTISPECIES: Fe-S-containing hydro-lyase [Clostridium]|uniref:Fumarate hydratase class I, anaerobic n=3 Tax=Clostridium TaxID=1485 RepID=D8GIK9_CLOLD|nr:MULTISPECIES: Fe-S-containing hydro-lyase [Clostridium]ADK17083.1 fumarate hydratase, beta subunit [Clostridium ljungdahlii DSM 13528]AGY76121.1 Fe-S-containing hydro-lyase [Clostridium autoethanogenum DSM 10061]ALU36283.1 Hydro-lyase Fe-S type tartrate/fumarate subfamily beta subunit [Clostridium autoethanogenum DSM 10061]OAA85151.1 Fumarate hydratase class I, anaerobic [Clostridium ljungdahlii DSM 13528]OVY48844.1 Fumarate hydratase class I, anaerobic [Clostridium autoethanogenum]
MEKKITTPLTEEKVKTLKAGDSVLISGTIYTARDAAHKRLVELLDEGKSLPINVKDEIIYYAGPSPAKPGHVIGSAGPTSSYRMDPFAPRLLDIGLKGMIGKGLRSKEVIESMKKNKAVYFAAIGGAAALVAKSIKKAEVVAYEDLDSEAIRKLEVKDLPVIVVIDSEGNNLYESGRKEYLDSVDQSK